MTIQTRAQEIEDEFAFLDDWEARYGHIIDLGKANPPLQPDERNEQTRVRGCASQVWMVTQFDGDTMTVRAESDALIVSGLIGLLTQLYSGATQAEISSFDAKALLERIGVTGALTAQRSNGLAAMLERIRTAAETSATAP